MAYSQMLRELFPGMGLEAEDLLLLETFQIKYLPDRVAPEEFATLLHTYPVLFKFLVNKYPPMAAFLTRLLDTYKPVPKHQIREHCQEALWEIGDLIIYNKHPELYDQNTRIHWDIGEISSMTSLEGKTVADVGAGSGRIAFLVAPVAQTVFAVEPLGSFRTYMKEKALKQGVKNLFVMDGTLDSMPLPGDSLDVLITSNAIGWNLDKELPEIERAVKPGGSVIHLLHSDPQQEHPHHDTLTSAPWDYQCVRKMTDQRMKIKYHKTMPL
jgi:ubiquinone/menaquinone biosynthesis C-methylase UbiE